MTDISKINPNGTEYNLKDATARAGIESSKTLKSSVVTVNDAAPINAEDITVDITPVQDLHGYDRPWAGGAGKNKLPNPTAEAKTVGSLTVSIDALGIITVSGSTPTTTTILFDLPSNFVIPVSVNAGGSGCLYLFNPLINNDIVLMLYNNDTLMDSWVCSEINRKSSSYVSMGGKTINKIGIRVQGATTISGSFKLSPMFTNDGTTDSTFAPYSNECPIEGRTGAELDRVGKNEYIGSPSFDGYTNRNSYSLSSETHNGHEVIYKSATWGGAYKTLILSKGTYTFSVMVKCSATATVSLYDSINGESVQLAVATVGTSWQRVSVTFEVTEQRTASLRLNLQTSNTTIYISEYQLELGATPTTYEPYQGQQYTASFGETVYGGKLDVKRGVLTITHVIADMGDLTWTYNNTNFVTTDITGGVAKTGKTCICSCYKTVNNVPYSTNTIDDNSICMSTVTAERLYVHDSTYSDASAFKTARTGQKICYELATPTTVQLTPQQIQLLQGINTVSADCGDTQLKYQPDNVVGELKGEIRTVEAELEEAEENLEIVYEDHVANTSMGIIVDGYSVGDMPFSNALDIAKTGYTPIAVTDTSVVSSTVADQGEIATHCLLDVTNNRVRFYVHVMDSAASLTIPPNSLTFRVAYKKA